MTPEHLFAFLNDYLGRMEAPIKENNGFIDKFIGDAIMALFDGNFRTQATGAVKSAVDMQKQLQHFNNERQNKGLVTLGTGIGIHIGSVMLGTLGNANRMDSTVIGDAVNLAARLEGLTKYYGCQIIVSDDVVQFLDRKQFALRELDLVVVKGREQAVSVYEVLEHLEDPFKERKKQLAKIFKEGLTFFRDRKWAQGRAAFQQCLSMDGTDKAAKIYLDRCAVFEETPPDSHWDGTFAMDHK